MKPTVGRIVLYTLSQFDADAIQHRRAAAGTLANLAGEGQTFPAVVVRDFGGSGVNLKVLLDGDDTYWACSRTEGTPGQPGFWAWPVREG